MIDKEKINKEIRRKTREHKSIDLNEFKYSDGFFSGYIKALEDVKRGKFND